MFGIFKKDTKKHNDKQDLSTDKLDRKSIKKENEKEQSEGIQFRPLEGRGVFIDETPYRFSSSFFEKNGKVGAILKLYISDGSNRKLNFLDVLDFIPQSTMEDVEMHLLVRDKVINQDNKKRLIKNNVTLSKATIENRQEDSSRKTAVDRDDASVVKKQEAKLEDYNDYESILDDTNPISVFDIRLVITANDEATLDDQIEVLNTSFNQHHSGAQWVSDPGGQLEGFESLFSELPLDENSFTATGDNFAGINFSVNAGLHDPEGIPLGQDILSLTGSKSYMNFDKSLNRQAIISAPSTAYNTLYYLEETDEFATLSSLLAQAAANDTVMRGGKAHHIVLNDFNYFDERFGYRFNGLNVNEDNFEDLFKVYNAAEETINPVQGFGEYQDENPKAESIENIYSRLKTKIENIFDIMLGFDMSHETRVFLQEQLDEYYKNMNYWNADSPNRPRNSNIIQIKNPRKYATLSNFQTYLGTRAQATSKNPHLEKTYRILENTVSTAISTNGRILNSPTSIERSHALQTYYMFGNIDDISFKQIQLVNMFDYIMYTAKEGEVVVIHGFNEVFEQVFEMLAPSIKAARRRGVRFIFAYDTIRGAMYNADFKYNDMFTMQHNLYSDLSSEVDYFMLGTMLPQEIDDLERKYLNRNLGSTVRMNLQRRLAGKFLVHRGRDSINNFIYSMFIV